MNTYDKGNMIFDFRFQESEWQGGGGWWGGGILNTKYVNQVYSN